MVAGIGRIAKPDKIQFVSGLPKTRSGKIMRRILRKVAENELGSLGGYLHSNGSGGGGGDQGGESLTGVLPVKDYRRSGGVGFLLAA